MCSPAIKEPFTWRCDGSSAGSAAGSWAGSGDDGWYVQQVLTFISTRFLKAILAFWLHEKPNRVIIQVDATVSKII